MTHDPRRFAASLSVRSSGGRGPTIFRVIVCVAAAFLLSAPRVLADDEAWKARVEKLLTSVETGVGGLDAAVALPGTPVERVKALEARLEPLEKAVGIVSATISGKDDLSALTLDAAALDSRWKAVVKARAAAKEPPKDPKTPPPPSGDDGAPGDDGKPPLPPPPADTPVPGMGEAPAGDGATAKKPTGKPWPKRIQFNATAKIAYTETGQWFDVEVTKGVFQQQFRMDGYAGKISFTVRAANLIHDVRSVVVRVAVRMKGTITESSDPYRINDVTWTAEKLLGDDSYKSWVNYDDFKLSAPAKWLAGPRSVRSALDAEAWVVSLVLADGTEMKFETPEFNPSK